VAGEILRTLLGTLKTRARAEAKNLFRFNQALLGGIPDPRTISLALHGIAYVPTACQTRPCPVHVAFHGCRQTIEDIGDSFYARTGYNPWAEANGVVVVYPQAIKQVLLGNPRGCWDWWGYTGRLYHTKVAPQIAVIANIARAFATGKAQLLPLVETSNQD
jgi:poly(3-hydroxybutyrate) depolymerase